MKKITSKKFMLDWMDFFKSILLAIITAVLDTVYTCLVKGEGIDLKELLTVSVITAISYLLKNFFEPQKKIIEEKNKSIVNGRSTIIPFIIFISFFYSCNTGKELIAKETKMEVKTIIEKRDSLIYVDRKGDEIYFNLCDTLGMLDYFTPIIKRKNGIITTLSINKGVAKCDCKAEIELAVKGLNSVSSTERIITETNTIEVNVLTAWQKFCNTSFWFLILIIGLLGLLYIKK